MSVDMMSSNVGKKPNIAPFEPASADAALPSLMRRPP
jgi:hypothetical protein